MKSLWVSWEAQIRNDELAKAFGCDYLKLVYDDKSPIIRYFLCIYFTVCRIITGRYDLIFVQCPSLVLTLLATILKVGKLRRYKLVIDAHNAATNLVQKKTGLLSRIMGFCFKSADFVIVSNKNLCSVVSSCGGTPLVLPDKLPFIKPLSEIETPNLSEAELFPRPHFVLVCSFCQDEPIEDFLSAVSSMSETFSVFVTGKKSKAKDLLRFESDRVRFLDYVPRETYDALIQTVDLMIVLTTNDNCLVCGGYEAISVGTPVMLSDTSALRDTFPCALFTPNTKEGFQNAIRTYLSSSQRHRDAIKIYKQDFETMWEKAFNEIKSWL